ncbi:oligosaccharide flippase family protein [Candidatus Saccharibacteria bacterium]|nr:oligosaccharide flippase family protein [Candidatus Saccharibacteria bacterium]
MNPTAPTSKPRSKRVPLASVATLLVATSLIGQVLGFLRTKLVNANFPATGPNSTDAYFAAFNIPDFFFFTIAAGALGVAFIPVLADHLQRGDRKGVNELTTSLLNSMVIIMFGIGVLMFVFAEQIIKHFVGPDQVHTGTLILRMIAFNPLFFTISGVLTSLQQSLGRFFFYAIAPLFYNSCIIASAIVFSTAHGQSGGPGELGVIGLGIGALAGAVAQMLVIGLGTINLRYRWQPRILWRSSDFRLILKQLAPRSLDQGVDQLNSIVETKFAKDLGVGNISYYNNAYVLSTAPALLIGTAISTAAFPRLSQRLSQGRPDLFRNDFLKVLRAIIWITAPVVIISYFARGYLARMIFTRSSTEIALVFGFLAGAIFFRTIYTILSRWFYAQKDTITPMFVSLFTISLNIFLAWWLTKSFDYGVAGLAIAQSVVAMVEVFILLAIMIRRDHGLINRVFWAGTARIISVSGFSMIAGYMAVQLYPLGASDQGVLTLGTKLAVISLVVFGTHVAVSALFGLAEARIVLRRLRRFIFLPIRLE